MEGDIEYYKSFKIECLLNKCITRRGGYMITQYLVRQIKYELEFDQWYSKNKLNNIKKLINNYKAKTHGMRTPYCCRNY